MNTILKQAISAALAVSVVTLTSMATGQTPSGAAPAMNQPGMPMGPIKAGPNAAVNNSLAYLMYSFKF